MKSGKNKRNYGGSNEMVNHKCLKCKGSVVTYINPMTNVIKKKCTRCGWTYEKQKQKTLGDEFEKETKKITG